MKIETLKITPAGYRCEVNDALNALKPGQVLRLHTAQEWRRVGGNLERTGKERGVKFCSMNDGDNDVLVFIREKKP